MLRQGWHCAARRKKGRRLIGARGTARGGSKSPRGRASTGRGSPMFSRIAVVNRGEPAMRLIRAVRELNAEHGPGIRVIALHTESERRATFVRAADEAVVLRE